jgi:hypothetical protein
MAEELREMLSIKQKPQDKDDGGESYLVMCVNSGHLALLLNFMCSLKKNKIPIPKHIIFAATPAVAKAVKRIGLTVYHHPALGNYDQDDKAAVKYADGKVSYLFIHRPRVCGV